MEYPFNINQLKVESHEIFNDFDIIFNKINIIIGKNGSGKSTLLDILNFHFDTHTPYQRFIAYGDLEIEFKLEHLPTSTSSIFKFYEKDRREPSGYEIKEVVSNNKIIRPIINYDDTNDKGMKTHQEFKDEIINKLETTDLLDKVNTILSDNGIELFVTKNENGSLVYGSRLQLRNGPFARQIGNISSGEYYLLKIICESINTNEILYIEEPEISLHPDWEMKLIDILQHDLIGDKQFFITTHSPYIFKSHISSNVSRIFTIQKNNSKSDIIPVDNFNFTWEKSNNGINYKVFNIITNEYHIELYDNIIKEAGDKSIKQTDTYIKKSTSYNHDAHYKYSSFTHRNEVTEYFTLPTFIRNLIHHPNENDSYSDDDLHESIKLMIEILKNSKFNTGSCDTTSKKNQKTTKNKRF